MAASFAAGMTSLKWTRGGFRSLPLSERRPHYRIEEDTDRIGRELPRGKLLSTLSSPAILFANHAAPCRQALGGMLLHPLGELRRAHQAGLH